MCFLVYGRIFKIQYLEYIVLYEGIQLTNKDYSDAEFSQDHQGRHSFFGLAFESLLKTFQLLLDHYIFSKKKLF